MITIFSGTINQISYKIFPTQENMRDQMIFIQLMIKCCSLGTAVVPWLVHFSVVTVHVATAATVVAFFQEFVAIWRWN